MLVRLSIFMFNIPWRFVYFVICIHVALGYYLFLAWPTNFVSQQWPCSLAGAMVSYVRKIAAAAKDVVMACCRQCCMCQACGIYYTNKHSRVRHLKYKCGLVPAVRAHSHTLNRISRRKIHRYPN